MYVAGVLIYKYFGYAGYMVMVRFHIYGQQYQSARNSIERNIIVTIIILSYSFALVMHKMSLMLHYYIQHLKFLCSFEIF